MTNTTTWDARPQRSSRARSITATALAVAALLTFGGGTAAMAGAGAPTEPVEPYEAGNAGVFLDQNAYDVIAACDGVGVYTLEVDGVEEEASFDLGDRASAESYLFQLEDETGLQVSEFGSTLPDSIVGLLSIFWTPTPDKDSSTVAVVAECVEGTTTITYSFTYLGNGYNDFAAGEYAALGWWYAIESASPKKSEPAFGGIAISCLPEPVAPGGRVVCYLEGPDAGDSIDWQASYNPVVASGTVVTDASGRASFSFAAPVVASGTVLTVSLPDDGMATTVTVSGAPIPTRIPAGEGSSSGSLALAGVVLALAGAVVARRRRAGAAA